MTAKTASKPRCAVLVGPYTSGKTTLLEAMLFAAGAIGRKGSITEGNTVGDGSPEARARTMTVEPNIAHCEYLGEKWSFIDCPGAVELRRQLAEAVEETRLGADAIAQPGRFARFEHAETGDELLLRIIKKTDIWFSVI